MYVGELRGPEGIRALAICLLLRWSLSALTSADSAIREVALRSLLPALTLAAGRVGSETGQLYLQAVWEQCRWLGIPHDVWQTHALQLSEPCSVASLLQDLPKTTSSQDVWPAHSAVRHVFLRNTKPVRIDMQVYGQERRQATAHWHCVEAIVPDGGPLPA